MWIDFLIGPVAVGQVIMVLNLECRYRLNLRKTFFTVRMVRCWNRFSRAVVDAPSLETLKVRFVRALSSLIWLK